MPGDKDIICVLDFGGQYAHLIADRIRRLGVFSEIHPSDIRAKKLHHCKGLIFSGGPGSVMEKTAPPYDKWTFFLQKPMLGICYGHQLMSQVLGGEVHPAKTREYGFTKIKKLQSSPLIKGLKKEEQVWMSHGDEVIRIPEKAKKLAESSDCTFAAVDFGEKRFGIQFHAEVTHTPSGRRILDNFLKMCGAKREWTMTHFLKKEIAEIKNRIGKRKVFLLVSGGVDSTVAFVLLAKAIGAKRIYGLFVDTGFLRKNERIQVEKTLKKLGVRLHVYEAQQRYFKALKGITDPEEKRKIIGDLFLDIQQEVSEKLKLNPAEWLLGQGTIYPDTIEAGGTKQAAIIKTHHNRVPRVAKLIKKGQLIEPLKDLYKDEVRELGAKLGLPKEVVWRHPFPGPGLAVRCLCAKHPNYPKNWRNFEKRLNREIAKHHMQGAILPIKSVGVQGDNRTYRHPFAMTGACLDWDEIQEISTELTNRFQEINRVIYRVDTGMLRNVKLTLGTLTENRIKLLQEADEIVMRELKHAGFMDPKNPKHVWQCPTVLLPIRVEQKAGESLVLRPVFSEEAMTAEFAKLPWDFVSNLARKLLDHIPEITAIFYDVTNKPPGTIEWE